MCVVGSFKDMTDPRGYIPALDRIEAALEASCGALITLESLDSQATERATEANEMQEHIGRARRSLREAIDSLRAAQSDGGADAIALGFVLKGTGRKTPELEPEAGQARPWRTA